MHKPSPALFSTAAASHTAASIQVKINPNKVLFGVATVKKKKKTRVGDNLERLESLYTVGGGQNGTATVGNSVETPQKIKELPCVPQFYLWAYSQENGKQSLEEPRSRQHYSQ